MNAIAGLLIVFSIFVQRARCDTLAFFYALDQDFQTLKAEAQTASQPLKVGSRTIPVLQLHSHRVYAVKMGSGAVETAASVQALLARIQCDAAFSVGPVGALSDKLKVGSWYRVAEVVSYQKGSWTKAGFQLSPNSSVKLNFAHQENLKVPALFAEARTIKVASGEIFVASDDYRAQLRESAEAEAVDMNLFGLVSVCADHRLPLVCWRVVSDRASNSASEDFRSFVASYRGEGGKAAAELITSLAPNPNSPQSYPNLNKYLSGQQEPK
jgi:adenosylhomocysteine nucleosidase